MKNYLFTFLVLFSLTTGATAQYAKQGLWNQDQGCTYEIKDNGTLTLKGNSNPIIDYVYPPVTGGTFTENCPWAPFGDEITGLDIVAMVTHIGTNAFRGLYKMKVKNINTSALTSIGANAFNGCISMDAINLGYNVVSIGDYAFANTGLKSITLNDRVESQRVTYFPPIIGTGAFSNNKYLGTIYLTDAKDVDYDYTDFLNDKAYIVVDDEQSATNFKARWTTVADRIVYPTQVVEFSNDAIKEICINQWDTNKDGNLSYEEAFAVTDFGKAFAGCTDLTTFDDLKVFVNVTTIGSGAFAGCTGFESITIPSHITDIADDAFSGCTNLGEIHFTTDTPYTDEITLNIGDKVFIVVPDEAYQTYREKWSNYADRIYGESHIRFKCANVRDICVSKWDTNKDDRLSYTEAATVTTIGTVFKGNTTITSFDEFKYFTKVTSIGSYAFQNCSSIASITIPNSVTSIGDHAFYSCRLLVSITIPNSVTSIEDYAFYYCSSLASITIPNSVTSIKGRYIFDGCTSLSRLVFEDGENPISFDYEHKNGQAEVFTNCPIESLYLGRNTSITRGFSPFQNNTKLVSVTIGNSVTSIKDFIFNGCSSLASITIPNSVTSIGSYAFQGCSSLASITIPNSVTSIGQYAFQNCSSLASITIPNSVTSIGSYAFQGCSSLASITIPNSVTTIGSYAFDGSLYTYTTIPASVTSIGNSAFNNSNVLVFDSETPITYSSLSGSAVFIVPDDAVTDYRNAWASSVASYRIMPKSAALEWKEVTCEAQSTESDLAKKIGEGNLQNILKLRISGSINSYDMMVMRSKMENLRELDLAAATIVANSYKYDDTGVSEDNVYPDFMKGKALISVVLPESITRIGSNALQECNAITSITLPANVTTVDSYAFDCMHSLSTFKVAEGSKLGTLADYAFRSTNSLKSIDLTNAEQLSDIEESTFRNSGIASIALPGAIQTVGNYAFTSCASLKEITLSARTLGDYAFSSCSALNTIKLPNATTLNKRTFDGCTALKSISMPNVSTIDTYVFNNCTSLKSIVLPSSLTSLGTYAFNNCTSLESVELPIGITSVPQYLFKGCYKLADVKLSPKTTNIESYAFQNCWGLKKFHLPPYLKTIQSGAFSGCSNLTEIYAYMPDVPSIAANTFSNYKTSTLYAPGFLFNAYFYDQGWNQFLYVLKCDLRPGDYDAFYTNKDLYFTANVERITQDRPVVELGAKGAIIVKGADQEFTSVDMEHDGTTSSSLIGDDNIPMDELRVKLSVNAYRWYFFCFPYDVEIAKCEYPGKYAWREYDGDARAQGGSGWKNIEGNKLSAKKGYIFQSDTKGTLWVKFAQPKFGGDRPTALEAHTGNGNAADASWNFVGNPYTSYYNMQSADFTSPITVWNGTSYVAYRPGDDDYHLQPFEAFFVQKPENTSEIAFDADRRETYNQSVAIPVATARSLTRSVAADRHIINIAISDNDTAMVDRTRLVLNQNASRSYEMGCDAAKFISDDAAVQIYTLEGATMMSMNERPAEGDILLGYVARNKGTYRLTAPRMDVPMTLVDSETGARFDLSEGDYTFSTEAGTFNKRFSLRFSEGTTNIEGLKNEAGVEIVAENGGLRIEGDKEVAVYTMSGAKMAEQSGSGFVTLTSGTYLVVVDGMSAKVVIK